MLRSIFFPSIVAPFKVWFLYIEKYSTVKKFIFGDIDTETLKIFVLLLLIVQLNSKLYFTVLYFGHLFYRQIKKYPPIRSIFTVIL